MQCIYFPRHVWEKMISKEKENGLVYFHPLHIPTCLRLTVARLFLYGNTVYGIRRYGAIYGFFYEPFSIWVNQRRVPTI